MTFNTSLSKSGAEKGFSMIEVLITLLILSVGLLGVASMQFVGSFSNKNALSRTQAVFVAQEMAERMRISMQLSQVTDGYVVDNEYFDAGNYNFDGLSCSGNKYNCHCLSLPTSIPDCLSNECSTADFAKFDAYQMSCAAVAANPSAEVYVTCTDNDTSDTDSCTAGSMHRIMVRWQATDWQEKARVANASCELSGDGEDDDYDCVALEVLL